jgi:adenine-specific DNA-methyltransferase
MDLLPTDLLPTNDVGTGLTARTEARRVIALEELPAAQRAQLGQFFTPERAADFIAGLPRLPQVGKLRVLDPGAGSGSLTAALVARVLRECPALELEIVAVEVDQRTTEFLADTVADISDVASKAGAIVTCHLLHGDYLNMSAGLTRPTALQESFDLVIMNPPYRKLTRSSSHRQLLSRLGVECSNLYACFLALGADCLKSHGQLVAITPRSFTNGPYFGQFRHFFLDRVRLDRIHILESRSTIFADTGVLQENIIFSATRAGAADSVALSVSEGHDDEPRERLVSYHDVVRPLDKQGFIRILTNDDDMAVAETMANLPSALPDLAMQVSTGRVVDFRSRECLLNKPTDHSYPLIYPGNVQGGEIDWPRTIRKNQGFAVRNASDQKFLLPEGYYVVVKRFSSKEERRRMVAAVWDPTIHRGPVAFENHLNIFHADGAGLERNLAVGLSYWLNSSLVDDFFRTFSGHTQVNATDLRSLRFPSRSELISIGKTPDIKLPGQESIDSYVATLIQEPGSAVA